MYEQFVDVTSKHGSIPSFMRCSRTASGPLSSCIWIGIREELRNIAAIVKRAMFASARSLSSYGTLGLIPRSETKLWVMSSKLPT